MKRIVSAICIILLLLSAAGAFALEGTIGNISWALGDSGLLTVSGSGYVPGEAFKSSSFEQAGDIRSVVIGEGITGVDWEAFLGCENLETVSLPASLQDFDGSAFYCCISLSAFTVAEGNPYFEARDGVLYRLRYEDPEEEPEPCLWFYPRGRADTGFTVPADVKWINENAFTECEEGQPGSRGDGSIRLQKITLSAGQSPCFANCTALENVILDNGTRSISSSMFSGCIALKTITVPDSIQSIGENAFFGCTAMETVNYGGSAEQWNRIAIHDGNEALASVSVVTPEFAETGFYDGITWTLNHSGNLVLTGYFEEDGDEEEAPAIPANAFANSEKQIVSIKLQGSIGSVGANAFSGIQTLKTVNVLVWGCELGTGVFSNNPMLETISLSEGTSFTELPSGLPGLQNIHAVAGESQYSSKDGVLYNNDGDQLLLYPAAHGKTYAVPEGVTALPAEAFPQEVQLKTIILAASVTSASLSGISTLEAIRVEDGNTAYSADSGLLYNAAGNTLLLCPQAKTGEIVLRESTETIGSNAFRGVGGWTSISIPADVTVIQEGAFSSGGPMIDVTGKEIRYLGTDWDDVSIEDDNDMLVRLMNPVDEDAQEGTTKDGLRWTLDDDGAMTILPGTDATGLYTPYEFSGHFGIRRLVIGEGVEEIGSFVFRGCPNLESVSLPASLSNLSATAFAECEKLTRFSVANENENFVFKNHLLLSTGEDYLLLCPSGLTELVIPDGVTDIGEYACAYSQIQSVSLPGSLSRVGESAFAGCAALEEAAYDGGSAEWAEISVENNNEALTAHLLFAWETATVNGIAWTWNRKERSLTVWNEGSSIIPEGLFSAAAHPDTWPSGKFTILDIGDMSEISELAFAGQAALTEVFLGEGVTFIGENAFRDCDSITSVHYSGTESDWADVTVESGNEALTQHLVFAKEGEEEGGISWWLDNGVLRVSGEGEIPSGMFSASEHPDTWPSGSIRVLYVNDGITAICDGAFAWQTELQVVYLPQTLSSISGNPFMGALKLNPEFEIGSNPYLIQDEDGVIYNSTRDRIEWVPRNYRGTYTMPDTVEYMDDGVFGANYWFDSQTDELLITDEFPYLTKIVLSPNLADFGDRMTHGLSALTEIEAPESETYTVQDNLLYSKDGQTLIYCPYGLSGEIRVAPGTKTIRGSNIDEEESTIWWAGAFKERTHITRVILPDGLTTIGTEAFGWCESLSDVTIPNSVTSIEKSAFESTGLTSLALPDGLTEVGEAAFRMCDRMESVTVPHSLAIVLDNAFDGCQNLTDVYYDGTYDEWDEIDIHPGNEPLKLARIHFKAMNKCGDDAYWTLDEDGLLSITGTGAIYDHYFENWEDILSVSIHNGITVIGNYTFAACSKLKTVTLPRTLFSIKGMAFEGCISLESISFSLDLESRGALISRADVIPSAPSFTVGGWSFADCKALASTDFLSRASSLGESAFARCSALTSLALPDSITELGANTFAGCNNLVHVSFGNGITSLPEGLFSDCENLTHVIIPDSVVTIEKNAFNGCYGLETIVYEGTDDEWASLVQKAAETGNTALFDDNLTIISEVIIEPMQPDFTLPEHLTIIEANAFTGIKAQYVYIGKDVTDILDSAFAGTNIKQLTIQATKVHFGDAVFGVNHDPNTLVIFAKPGSEVWKWAENNGNARPIPD